MLPDKQRTKEVNIDFWFSSTFPSSVQDFQILSGNINFKDAGLTVLMQYFSICKNIIIIIISYR